MKVQTTAGQLRAGLRLSAANMLLLCKVLDLDPFGFLVERPRLTLKTIVKQAVTQSVQREAQEVVR